MARSHRRSFRSTRSLRAADAPVFARPEGRRVNHAKLTRFDPSSIGVECTHAQRAAAIAAQRAEARRMSSDR